MSQWLISIPVWGESYLYTFTTYTVPALRAALEESQLPVRFMIHTDQPATVREALEGFDVIVHPVIGPAGYTTLQYSHRDAVNAAKAGEYVALLNADLIVSKNLFSSCETHLSNGRPAVVLAGIRTVMDYANNPPPIGMGSRELLEWAWEHRHQIIRDLEWDTGRSMLPTNLFFVQDDTVVLHGFHLHPVAIKKPHSGEMNFISTIDGDLLEHFDTEQIHLVSDPDDMSMLEISPPERRFPVRDRPFTAQLVAGAMMGRASMQHCLFFQQRLVVKGTNPDACNEMPIVEDIVHRITTADASNPIRGRSARTRSHVRRFGGRR